MLDSPAQALHILREHGIDDSRHACGPGEALKFPESARASSSDRDSGWVFGGQLSTNSKTHYWSPQRISKEQSPVSRLTLHAQALLALGNVRRDRRRAVMLGDLLS